MLKPGFDLIAPYYDFLAGLVFGRTLKKAQLTFLDNIPEQARILIIGGGSGWLLPEIFARTSTCQIVYLEASANMLNQAKQKIKDPAQAACVEFRFGTENNIQPEEEFEVVISFFFLDLFLPAELENITHILFRHLQPGGLWLVTDFVQTHNAGLWQIWTKILTQSMYRFFRVVSGISATTLPDWQNILAHYNLAPQKSAYFYHNLIKSVLYQKK
ncbi:class I SAM-dependent methyltransferase [Adhaeribacter rhizoryzae]|nr:class I SAM-dependent methyltransferase [Adhaeribacter rhizoryzae]